MRISTIIRRTSVLSWPLACESWDESDFRLSLLSTSLPISATKAIYPITDDCSTARLSKYTTIESKMSWKTLSFTSCSTVLLPSLLLSNVFSLLWNLCYSSFERYPSSTKIPDLPRRRCFAACCLSISEGVLDPPATQSFDAILRINCNSSD